MGQKVTADEFEQFAKYQNDMAVANHFKDMSHFWADPYDDGSKGFDADKFMKDMGEVWVKLKPYYSKLHAYVRMKLRPTYHDHIDKEGYMPMNIFGNMWAQDWTNLDTLTKPYPETPNLDATDAMIAAKYDVDKIFKEADKFFGGLGLETMTDSFWNKSMLTRPEGRDVVCHASAEDFCTGKTNGDYRIKMCTQVNMDDLVTVHHEMGHIEYYMQYNEQNLVFRTGANPGFHEAIGDALGLAVTTPAHLTCVLDLDLGLDIDCGAHDTDKEGSGRSLLKGNLLAPHAKPKAKGKSKPKKKAPGGGGGGGLLGSLGSLGLKNTVNNLVGAGKPKEAADELPEGVTKMDINFLYYKALEKFSFFPFALFIDIWRFEVFSGKLKKDKYTDRWWELRKEYQGIVPPKKRKSSNFDPAAKHHIVANVEYIRYFISHILQFQFYEAMCIAAGEYSRENPKKPLYQCDFTDSKEAGKALGDMMKLGFIKPWPEALEKVANIKTLSIEPLMNYFKPLFDKITKDLKRGKEKPCFGKHDCY